MDTGFQATCKRLQQVSACADVAVGIIRYLSARAEKKPRHCGRGTSLAASTGVAPVRCPLTVPVTQPWSHRIADERHESSYGEPAAMGIGLRRTCCQKRMISAVEPRRKRAQARWPGSGRIKSVRTRPRTSFWRPRRHRFASLPRLLLGIAAHAPPAFRTMFNGEVCRETRERRPMRAAVLEVSGVRTGRYRSGRQSGV
jgi:hypothetical protein